MRQNNRTLVTAALMAALACVATMIIKIPSPMKGYINLGDSVVLLAGWVLPPAYGFLAGGLGSALADLFSGYPVYVPATFVIKGMMALIARGGFALLRSKLRETAARILSAAAAEVMMIIGYFIAAGFLYGFGPAMLNVPANAVQGIASVVIGILLINFIKKSKVLL